MVDVTEKFIELTLVEMPNCNEAFLRDQIKRKIVTFVTMRQYCIVKLMPTYLKCNKGVIKHAIYDMEDDFGVSGRYIRKVQKEHRQF